MVVRAGTPYLELLSSTFILDDLYGIVFEAYDLYSLTVADTEIKTLSSTGSAAVLSSFSAGSMNLGQMNWAVTDLSYSSPSTVPRMRISCVKIVIGTSMVFPTLDIADSSEVDMLGPGPIKFTGNITANGPTALRFLSTFDVHFSSISIASGLSFACGSNTLFYLVSNPHHGIQCLGGPGCITPSQTEIRVVWESNLPLPIAGELYPGINNPHTFVSNSTEYTITSSNSSSISYFSFQTVQCDANCIASNSGNCISNTQCTCRGGFEGINCEIAPPITPEPSTPTNMPPSEISIPIAPEPSTPTNMPPSDSSPTSSAHYRQNYACYLGFISILLLWI